MIAFLRFFIPFLVVQTVVYVVIALRARGRERRRLEAEWDEAGGGGVGREEFVDRGLRSYERSLRRKLLLAIYIVPWVALVVIIQYVNR